MPEFSRSSEDRLASCHPDLQRVLRAAIKRIDFAVLCGHRGRAEQEIAFRDGFSNAPWPQSRHNSWPAEAVDIAPYPVDWRDVKRFKQLAMIVLEEAARQGVPLKWGGDFKAVDMPHFELA